MLGRANLSMTPRQASAMTPNPTSCRRPTSSLSLSLLSHRNTEELRDKEAYI